MSLREAMPTCAAFLDELRDIFGKEEVDAMVRRGLRPDCPPEERCYFSENGIEVGKRYEPDPARTVSLADMVIGEPFRLEKKEKR